MKYGVNIGGIADNLSKTGTYAHFTREKGQSFFSIGPTFGNKKDLGHLYHDRNYYSNTYSINGFRAVYQVSPNPARKVFQSYIHNEFVFHYYSDKGITPTVYSANYGSIDIPNYTRYYNRQVVIGNYLGWGFNLKLPGHFYINQSVALGIVNYANNNTYEISSYNRKFNYFDYTYMFKTGIGHTFDYKLKPIFKTNKQKKDFDSVIDSDIANMDAEQPKKTKLVWGTNVGVFNMGNDIINSYANLTLNHGKNYYALGVTYGNYDISNYGNIYKNGNLAVPFTGINAVYERTLFPNRRIDMGFHYDFIYQTFGGSGLGAITQISGGTAYTYYVPYYTKLKYIKNYISYTFKEYVFGNFYLNQSLGLGIIYHKWHIDYPDNASHNQKAHNAELGLLLKFGIGYKFATKPVFEKRIKKYYKKDSIPNKAAWGINVGIYSPVIAKPSLYTNITFEKGKNALELGILTGEIAIKSLYYNYLTSNKYGVTGINIVYQRFTKLYNRHRKFYFQNWLSCNYISFSGTQNIYYPYNPPVVMSYNYNVQETIFADILGYGCKVNIFKHFFIDQCFGLGITRYASIYRNDKGANDNVTITEPAFLFKLGIGYRFNKE